MNGTQIIYMPDCVIKKFDFDYGIDSFGYSAKHRYETEVACYKLLETYNITPKVLSITDDSITLERYEMSLSDAISRNIIPKRKQVGIMAKIIDIAKLLDKIGVMHNDWAPRNIVCRKNFDDIAIIDFGLSDIVKCDNITNLNQQFFENMSDL